MLFASRHKFVNHSICNILSLIIFDRRKISRIKVCLKKPTSKLIDVVLKLVDGIILLKSLDACYGDSLSERQTISLIDLAICIFFICIFLLLVYASHFKDRHALRFQIFNLILSAEDIL